ncbi:hypothetical protein C9374_010985 [Naegleria lovaniensis]|uniref:Uncharacterized protein n=1 Tax=Naegleria lovaniensis TaxID=51637 RepID=A0AA88KDH9_NAELO|nr:uncharacterized protein C9374_010985 [Naegleria lovaniensis]KAG2374148.1 hypothetical protein C9374_010985 [Naegleria lovaniensis]
MVLECDYCQCFDLEDLGERCLLFVVLMEWLVNECKDKDVISKEWDDLKGVAETWDEGKTSHNENASNRDINQSSIANELSGNPRVSLPARPYVIYTSQVIIHVTLNTMPQESLHYCL